ncbi:MAG: STAS domain-containing protein [Candidatus Accumulibacter sp.]|nr:STAS domain-containing protein [Accumulibacter sp.]
MVARPAAVPRPPAGGANEKTGPEPGRGQASDAVVEDFSDIDVDFTRSSLDFQVDVDVDPINAPAEEAAVLFANSQDPAAQLILENALKLERSNMAERLWLMLFDLYRISGQRPAFEAMGIDYARAFEKSPPIWGQPKPGAASAAQAAAGRGGYTLFKGDLLGSNTAAIEAARAALAKTNALRLDMSKVKQLDAAGCAGLRELLWRARKEGRGVEIRGSEALTQLVKDAVEAGKMETPPAGKDCWLLLFELLQQQGQQEVFEDLAIDYAVTFEESPPSWEPVLTAAPAPAKPEAAEDDAAEEANADADGAYVLSGEIRSSRFEDLSDFASQRPMLVIDCARLTRIDFVSAGALLNTLTTARNKGRQVVFRHPNRLVAELFRVVGLTGVAGIVFAKN